MKRKISSRENTKNIPEQEMEKEVPFGDPPKYYKYRCSHCQFENEMNEANVDVAFGWTKKRTKCSRGLMPVLKCPNCSRQTYECVD
jgi:DNA-directed RNA polymerase subunit RPC12/RpoP